MGTKKYGNGRNFELPALWITLIGDGVKKNHDNVAMTYIY